MQPHWLEIAGWVALALGFACALFIAVDIVVLGNWQDTAIMNAVFPLSALYMGPLAVWGYLTLGRRMTRKHMRAHGGMMESQPIDSWQEVSISASHCGAGCVLGDIVGEWTVWATGWTIGATAELGPEFILDLPLAWIFGILFQYLAIAERRRQVGRFAPLPDAIRSDTLTVLSFEAGLFAWMALAHFVIWRRPLPINSSSWWFMMQIGMLIGYLTSWPVNRWLLRRGIKEPMLSDLAAATI